jgi:hypothetical protein
LRRRALSYLLCGERLLRKTRIPELVYARSRRADPTLIGRFDEYVRETSRHLRQINRVIAGDVPAWLPEIEAAVPGARTDNAPVLPTDLFCPASLGS